MKGPYLQNLKSPSPKVALCKVWMKLAKWFWTGRFLILSMYFRYIVIISPRKRAWSFIWTKLNHLHPRVLCAKFAWLKLAQWFFIRRFLNWKRVLPLTFKQTWIPFTQGCFVSIWLKLAQWFWGRRFSNFINVFSLIGNHLPLEQDVALHLNKLEYFHHPMMLCAKFGWNWPSDSGEEDENVKSLQTDRQMDGQTDRRQAIRKAGELKTFQVHFIYQWCSCLNSSADCVNYNLHKQTPVKIVMKNTSMRSKGSFSDQHFPPAVHQFIYQSITYFWNAQ